MTNKRTNDSLLTTEERKDRHRKQALQYYYEHREEKLAYQKRYQVLYRSDQKLKDEMRHVTRERYRRDNSYHDKILSRSKAYQRRKRARRILPEILTMLLAWNERRQV